MIHWFEEPIPQLKNTVLTMGNFDGLHLGHQKLLAEVLGQAQALNLTPVILTYLEHPGHFVHFSHPVKILTPRKLKQEQIKQAGMEHVYFLNFSSESAHITADEFLRDVLIKYFQPTVIVSGYDTHFGYQRKGNTEFLIANESKYGYRTIQIEPQRISITENQSEIISSSLIRECLTQGKVEMAAAMLGRAYRLYGTVTHGQKIGTIIGFPTINLNLADPEQLIPANGIYLTKLMLQGIQYFGLTNIGISPTLKNSGQIEIETHILDFADDLYDAEIELDFVSYIRGEKRFNTAAELVTAIKEDIAFGMGLIKNYEL